VAAAAAAMLNRLNVQQTKSRPDHSSDNGLAETKNGGVIRKHPGYDQIRFGARRPGETTSMWNTCQPVPELPPALRFEKALAVTDQLPVSDRGALIARLEKVRLVSHNFGYGVGDDMDSILSRYKKT